MNLICYLFLVIINMASNAQSADELISELKLPKSDYQLEVNPYEAGPDSSSGTTTIVKLLKEAKFRGNIFPAKSWFSHDTSSDQIHIRMYSNEPFSGPTFDGAHCWNEAYFYKNEFCLCELVSPMTVDGVTIPETAKVHFRKGKLVSFKMTRRLKLNLPQRFDRKNPPKELLLPESIGGFLYELNERYTIKNGKVVPFKIPNDGNGHNSYCGWSDPVP